jgi:hypothetical protein
VFRVEKFTLSRRAAADHLRARRLWSAAAVWSRGAWTVLSSRRAVAACLSSAFR